MDDVRGLFLGMPHGTTPAAVTTNKNIIMCSFKSCGDIQKKEGGQMMVRSYNELMYGSLYDFKLIFNAIIDNHEYENLIICI